MGMCQINELYISFSTLYDIFDLNSIVSSLLGNRLVAEFGLAAGLHFE